MHSSSLPFCTLVNQVPLENDTLINVRPCEETLSSMRIAGGRTFSLVVWLLATLLTTLRQTTGAAAGMAPRAFACPAAAVSRVVTYNVASLKQWGHQEEIWKTISPDVLGLQGTRSRATR